MLKSGLLHEANGGYIIFQARDLVSNGICYEALKKALRMKELLIENTADPRTSMVMISLKPEPIPLDLKVFLVGMQKVLIFYMSICFVYDIGVSFIHPWIMLGACIAINNIVINNKQYLITKEILKNE